MHMDLTHVIERLVVLGHLDRAMCLSGTLLFCFVTLCFAQTVVVF